MMRVLPALTAVISMVASAALAQSPRTRGFTTSHDFIGSADLSGGVVVVAPESDTPRTPHERLRSDDSSLRLPMTTSSIASPNLARPDVTVDSSDPNDGGYTTAPITNGTPPIAGDAAGLVWRSANAARQHFVDLAFHDGPRDVSSLTVDWGVAGGPSRWKIQVADASGWLVDATGWQDATGAPSSTVSFVGPISTRRIRAVQDTSSGPAGAPELMTVSELSVTTADVPPIRPVRVDSSYTDYAPSFIADGDTRVGTTAEFWTEVWVSADSAAEHWVEVDLVEPRLVAQADVYWGRWGSARFKVQYWTGSAFVDTSTSAGVWLDGAAGQAVSRVQFEPVTTTRMRVLQDANGGIPPYGDGDSRVGLMSVAEFELRSAHTHTPGLLTSSADSSYLDYSPSALIDGTRTATCPPSECNVPGQLWVSAETPVEHFAEIRLGQLMYVGTLLIDWGAWGSNAFTVRSWNGVGWVDHMSGSVGSNGLVEAPIGAYTDRLRVVQPAGAGSGRPVEGDPRPNLMSIGEIALSGHRGRGRYVSAPIRMSDPIAAVTLTAPGSSVGSGQSASYAISSDDGATWTTLMPGVSATPPPGDRLRWRVDLAGQGTGTPEIPSVQLALTGQPREIAAALWRNGRSGAISAGTDDSKPAMLAPPLDALNDWGFKGTSFVCFVSMCGFEIPPFSLDHELASHTVTHGCAGSPPDGSQSNSLLAEFTQQQDVLDAALSERGRVQSMAWPCGNYDLAKGSIARRFFVSARGFRDGDPGEQALCGPDAWVCAHPEGEPMELVEEPTPRNFMNLKALAADAFRLLEFVNVPDAVDWAEDQGDWVVLVYHHFDGVPYHGEIAAMVDRDVWVAPQGEVARYVKLRDSFASETVGSSATSRDFRVSTTLSPADVPAQNHALAWYPPGEVVERVFDGGVTARVHSPSSRGTAQRALVWGNAAPLTTLDLEENPYHLEGNPYLLFDTPLAPYPTPIHVDWVAPGDADGDSVPNDDDNCTYRANLDQADVGGVAFTDTNGVGDLCECGDVSNDGGVDTADVTALRTFLAGGALSADGLAKCSVIDLASPTCDVADLTVLRRRLETRPLLPGTFPVCVAARP